MLNKTTNVRSVMRTIGNLGDNAEALRGSTRYNGPASRIAAATQTEKHVPDKKRTPAGGPKETTQNNRTEAPKAEARRKKQERTAGKEREPLPSQRTNEEPSARQVREAKKESTVTWAEVARKKTGGAKTTATERESQVKRTKSWKGKAGDAVLIKRGGLTYVDLLKKVKDSIDPGKNGVEITAVRQTRLGDLLIQVGKSAGEASKLKAAVEENLPELGEVKKLSKRTEVWIRDLDATATAEEVTRAVNKAIGEAEVLVKPLRPAYANTQVAIVELAPRDAGRLLRTEELRVGWGPCRVRMRTQVRIQLCYRCQERGHLAAQCQGKEDRSRECFRCGDADHLARNCTKKPFCSRCKQPGHGCRSPECPIQRSEAQEEGGKHPQS